MEFGGGVVRKLYGCCGVVGGEAVVVLDVEGAFNDGGMTDGSEDPRESNSRLKRSGLRISRNVGCLS